ncbi:MAG: pectic acid lyase [Verrucomicrobia bacterium]|nr:pectic acid lyase [Verrucomicrobiota bacterium]
MRTFRCGLLMLALLGFATNRSWGDDGDLRGQVRAALEKATAYMRSISTEGGYLWKYSLDLKNRAGEVKATATQIWIQPPGTPSVGMAFLRAYEATKDARYLDAAKAAADALARGQLESGGWGYSIDFDPNNQRTYLRSDKGKLLPKQLAKQRNITTFDDNNTQSAIRFLLAVADASKGSSENTSERDARIREALDYGLKKMLEAQYPNGAWPQGWNGQPHKADECPVTKARYPESYPREHPKQSYYAHYTLNDNTQRDCIETMLDAWHRTGKPEYLAAAKKGGDFLILAQMPEPQPAWAQQYNFQMEPAWARAFEPPAITGNESVGAMHILMDLFIETSDEKYLQPLPAAVAWFKRSAIAPGKWARYYELKTNKQIFGDRDGKIYYRLEDISEERQKHYSWSGDYGVEKAIAFYERLKRDGRETFLKTRETKTKKSSSARSLTPAVKEIIAALDSQGRWVTQGHAKQRDWEFDDRVETVVFIKNVQKLCKFLEAVGR